MLHKFSVIAELHFDDENGEYQPPTKREIEANLSSATFKTFQHMGITYYHLEVANGNLKETFSIGE